MHHTEIPYSRRGASRHAVSLECEVRAEGWSDAVPHRATNLSTRGIWVESQLPLEPGSRVHVSVTPPGWSRPLSVAARVARVGLYRRRNDTLASGMGLQFEDLDDAYLAALAGVLSPLPPPLPCTAARSRWLMLGSPELPAAEPDADGKEVHVRVAAPLLRG